eukprot:1522316-Amphidinium_carterae.1
MQASLLQGLLQRCWILFPSREVYSVRRCHDHELIEDELEDWEKVLPDSDGECYDHPIEVQWDENERERRRAAQSSSSAMTGPPEKVQRQHG